MAPWKFKLFFCTNAFILLFCVKFFRMRRQNLPLKWPISQFFPPDVCQFRLCHTPTSAFLFTSERDINFSKESDRNCRILKTFKISVFFWKRDEFFEENHDFFLKSLKLEFLPWNATEIVRFVKTFKFLVFEKKINNRWVFREKILNFFQITKGNKFVVEFDWNSKSSENAPNMGFLEKIGGFFRKKTLKKFKIATCGKFFAQCVPDGIFSWKCPSTLILRFFGQNSGKRKIWRVEKYDEKTESFEKNAFFLLKDFFNNARRRKKSQR